MSDCESFDPSPAQRQDEDSDESFDVVPVVGPALRRGAGTSGRERPALETGTFGVWLLTGPGGPGVASEAALAARTSVIGLARVTWRYDRTVADPVDPGAPAAARGPGAGARDRGSERPWGVVTYVVEQAWKLDESVDLPLSFDETSAAATVELARYCKDLAFSLVPGTVGDLLDASGIVFSRLHYCADGDRFFEEPRPSLLRTVHMRLRVQHGLLFRDFPPKSAIARWRRDADVRRAPNKRSRAEDAVPPPEPRSAQLLFELPELKKARIEPASSSLGNMPTRLQKRWDPIKVLNAVAVSSHLRQVKEFTAAVHDVDTYTADPDNPPPPRDPAADVGRTTLDMGKAKADVVGMLVHRRRFHAEMEDDLIDAIGIYSDASPVVGAEIQGMVLDFVRANGEVRRVPLPGSTLTYGHFDAMNKSMALVWAIWLVCGPLEKHLVYFFKGALYLH